MFPSYEEERNGCCRRYCGGVEVFDVITTSMVCVFGTLDPLLAEDVAEDVNQWVYGSVVRPVQCVFRFRV